MNKKNKKLEILTPNKQNLKKFRKIKTYQKIIKTELLAIYGGHCHTKEN